jgi:FixJ family two-component response regulator
MTAPNSEAHRDGGRTADDFPAPAEAGSTPDAAIGMVGDPVVHVVDPATPDRRALATVVQSAGVQALTYASAEELLAAFDPATPGCVVTELKLPGLDGLTLVERLRSTEFAVPPPVMIVTAFGDVASARLALKAGAVDFIEKPIDPVSFLSCLLTAVNQDRAMRLRELKRRQIRTLVASLTPRERQVMRMVVSGQTTKSIAATLGLSPKTVDFHRANIMTKMQTRSVAHLVRLCITAEP